MGSNGVAMAGLCHGRKLTSDVLHGIALDHQRIQNQRRADGFTRGVHHHRNIVDRRALHDLGGQGRTGVDEKVSPPAYRHCLHAFYLLDRLELPDRITGYARGVAGPFPCIRWCG